MSFARMSTMLCLKQAHYNASHRLSIAETLCSTPCGKRFEARGPDVAESQTAVGSILSEDDVGHAHAEILYQA